MSSDELRRLVPDAPRSTLDLLQAARGALQPAIRSEIFGLQRLAQHGRSLGLTHRAARVASASGTFFPRLRSNIAMLRQAQRHIAEQAGDGSDISPAAEWLLDNFHLIEAQLEEIHKGLPRSYFRQLPVLLDEPLAGLPRIYGVAWAFVAHTDGAFDEELLAEYLRAYQSTRELDLAEIWALPTTLRVVLVENLRRLAEREAASQAARELANLCCDRIDSLAPATLDRLHMLMGQRGVGAAFLSQTALRLQSRRHEVPAGDFEAWQPWLQKALPDPTVLQAQYIADQTADNLSVSNAVTSLRAIGDAEWSDLIASTSALVLRLLGSPLFAAENATTRSQTLHAIERLARRSGRSELAVADTLLALMRSPPAAGDPAAVTVASHWLQGQGRPRLMRELGLHEHSAVLLRALLRRAALPAYLGTLLAGTMALVAWWWLHAGGEVAAGWRWLGAALLLWPASETVVALVNRLISESIHPRSLPRLALADGIPADHRVIVVVPALLTGTAAVDALAHRLLLHHLANPEAQAQFVLLTDGADADAAELPGDGALLAHLCAALDGLNARHGDRAGALQAPRFIVLHRARRWSPTERRWIGWERKRGKLEQLIAALAVGAPGDFLDLGESSKLATGVRYIVTLDSDTQLPPGRLRELVGVAAHPHNRPQLSADGRQVIGGYGILQPRIVTPLPAPGEFTLFHGLFAGQPGIDPYSAATSEVYQDLFGEGSFSGKGLLDVMAVHAVLGARLPEGQVLSHDLLEGSLARCAAVSDITLIEDAPFHADVAASRVHRWTRGDWQLLPLLLQPGRWSLRAINRWKLLDNLRRSLVAPAALALLVLSLAGVLPAPLTALAFVMAAFSAGPLMGAVAGFAPSRDDLALRHFYRQAGLDLLRAAAGGLWHLAQLLQQALASLDAIGRALWRSTVSHRHLLQWTTAAAAQAASRTELLPLLRQHSAEPVLALLLWAALWLGDTPVPALTAALCTLWALAPLWTWLVSRPLAQRHEAALEPDEAARLEAIAHDAWHYFQRTVVAGDHYLPPDNLQTDPHEIIAHRTSPTNIGMYLLSAACARDFGWIDSAELLARLQATLGTLLQLQRHRGHFLNWYDTETLAPLLPMYLSTVDSGNLSGHLLAVAQACQDFASRPAEIDHAAALRELATRFEVLAFEADFRFLYHRKRHLFHIGWRVAEQQLDGGFYDLLASESRLTSLLAIAKGDVPMRHWAALGRPFYAVGARAGLRSWSGSMFEYLMPSLVLDEPVGSALHEANRAALVEQQHFATLHAVPWGISESAYAGRDHTLAYQYAPQGVPRLALRRTPADELVVAPYATALAAQMAPRAALANFAVLQVLAPRQAYGFIEALDFTPERQPGSERFTPVRTFMAHHQGMSVVALANVLRNGVARRWCMADPHVEAVASLLHERAPREVSRLYAPPPGAPRLSHKAAAPGLWREVLPGAAAVEPTHVLGNGRYSVTLRANGAGWSRRGTAGIGRWRDDALRDACGSFFYLRWDQQPRPVSITQHPAPDPAAVYQSVYHADRVSFDAAWPGLQAQTTVWVSPEDDIEFRTVELRNLSDRALDIELISAFEPTLADPRADEAHPAFGNLFVRAAWLAPQQALLFQRMPRLEGEAGLQVAHFLAASDPQVVQVRGQVDRQRWRGRNRDVSRPLAEFDALPAGDSHTAARLDTGLDPVCALAVQLRIAPQGKARLTFATAACETTPMLRSVIDKYRQASHVERASLMSATLGGIRRRELRIGTEDFAAIQSLTTALVFSLTLPGARAGGACDRRLLWRFGISGDRPLLLVSAGMAHSLGLLRTLAQALRLWAWGGIACDLVVLNTEPSSYPAALHHEIQTLRDRHGADGGNPAGPRCTGFHVLRLDELSSDEATTLNSLARLRLVADGRALAHPVQEWLDRHESAFERRHGTSTSAVPLAAAPAHAVPPPVGRFDTDSGEFTFDSHSRLRPRRPWVNVLANPGFGSLLSEAGGGYSWAVNSRLNQLTAWSNDPVTDPPAELFLLQDQRTLQAWSLAPTAWCDEAAHYRITHGQGESRFVHRRGDLEVSAHWCVDPVSAIKQLHLRVHNLGLRTQRLRLVGVVEWLMGAERADRRTVDTSLHCQRLPDVGQPGPSGPQRQERKLTALLCTQRERSAGFGEGTAFLAFAGPADAAEDWTCDRRECFDARGRLVLPDHFGQRSGAGLDPCAALSIGLRVKAGASVEQVLLLGHAATPSAARQLAAEAVLVPAGVRLQAVRAHWDGLLGATSVRTPDPLFDVMVNRWLLYQAVACRLWAKAGFYQAGGATGFRDQLQDAMALAWAAPAMLREQILRAASRQFPEGDVQHWWHAPGGAGVRTHFSDDLLWLAQACLHHQRATGDHSLLDEEVPFIEGPPIPLGAEDRYDTPTVSGESASVYEHAARAIDRSLRTGVHGLPLMGSGDWNDGMNRVGHQGRGESVWLAWFLCQLVAGFAPLAEHRGEAARAARWRQAAEGWQAALVGPAWDGAWFRRAFFDDGQALGSAANAEGRIDLIAQAWSVLSGAAPLALQQQAMASAEALLVDKPAGLMRLLDPPLVHAEPSAGYIQAYPPGVRENGGQYAHGAIWALMAQAALPGPEAADRAWRDFTWLSPAHRAADPVHGAVYGLEPYVMAGDVYSQPPWVGRGGWSWYTGAAAWLHRAAVESIFGLQLEATSLRFTPKLPSHWPRAQMTLRRDGRTMRFILARGTPASLQGLIAGADARVLQPGELLHWPALPDRSCHVVPLAPQATAGPAAAEAEDSSARVV